MLAQTKEIRYFFYSQAFADGFRATIAILLPALVGYHFNLFQEGLAVSLGAMCVSLTDAPGPITHKKNGLLFAAFLACLMTAITGFARFNVFTLGLEIVIAGFFFSMFNVYGARATSIGNSGILMMILTMDVTSSAKEVAPHAMLVLAGGIFYTFLSLLLHALRPYRIAQRTLGDCLREISVYLSIKADFYGDEADVNENYRRLVSQQVIVHEKQEAVRELLFKTRLIVNETTADGRRLVFAFVEAIDLFENITASYYDYEMLRSRFAGTGALGLVHQMLEKASRELDGIGIAIQANTHFEQSFNYDEEFKKLKARMDGIVQEQKNSALVLLKILVSIRKLFNDLTNILRYFETDVNSKKTRLDTSRFVTHQSLDPRIFVDNLTLQSAGFRHALRVSIACLLGFTITKFISYGHHSYWVLLTIAFILKPAYSLTKQRNIQRLLGTLIGGMIGVCILILTPNKTVHLVFLVLFMLGSYSFLRVQYLVTVICTTPYILILFSFLGSEFKVVAEERLLDTAIGGVIALGASYLLFPSWESNQLSKDMRGMLKANTGYLQNILRALAGKTINILDYKLARKEVYLNSANLSATFQRMLSEPRSKQKAEKEMLQFVVLNHILFSNTATLATTFLSSNPRVYPTELVALGNKILHKLNESNKKLNQDAVTETKMATNEVLAQQIETPDDGLMKEQLNFIYNLSVNLEKTITSIIG